MQETRAYTISAIRMITSFLGYVELIVHTTHSVLSHISMLGALSIIVSALVRRRVSSSEVHPIFMLSLADCMLGLLWIVGAYTVVSSLPMMHTITFGVMLSHSAP